MRKGYAVRKIPALALLLLNLRASVHADALSSPGLQTSSARTPSAQTVPRPIADIYCGGGLDRAAGLAAEARARFPDNRALALFAARVDAERGFVMKALRAYETIAAGETAGMVEISCAGRSIASGDAAKVAAGEAEALRLALADNGVLFDAAEAERMTREAREAEAMIERPAPPPPPVPSAPPKTKKKSARKAGTGDAASKKTDEDPTVAQLQALVSDLKGETFVHLGTGRGLLETDNLWTKLAARNAGLAARTATVWRVSLKSSGETFYRLGVLIDAKADADALCATLTKSGQFCQLLSTYGVQKNSFSSLSGLLEASVASRAAREKADREAGEQQRKSSDRAAATAARRLMKEAGEINKMSEEEIQKKYGGKKPEDKKSEDKKPEEKKP